MADHDLTLIDSSHWQGKLNSKLDFFNFLKYQSKLLIDINSAIEGYYLPSYKKTSMRFIKDFLRGEKDLLKTADIQKFNVPPYEKFAVKDIFEHMKYDANVMRYLNYYEDSKDQPEREYLFGVIGTLYPNYLHNIIQAANNHRNRDE